MGKERLLVNLGGIAKDNLYNFRLYAMQIT